ncbi:MAG: aprataxin-like protein [Geoglossum umbratile]|nr:MAG: aprataxin-like protein [Geoglossum umbratile]
MDADMHHGRLPADAENPLDAISKDEIDGTAAPFSPGAKAGALPPKKRNAFTALMSRKPAKSSTPKAPALGATPRFFDSRDGLGVYITDPASFPPSIVIYHTPKFVVVNDRYPKASVHLLILPRDPSKSSLHPYEAFDDPVFRAEALAEVGKVKTLVAKELRRRYGRLSTLDKAREEAMETDPPPDELPSGRDWEREVISGLHAHPSMNHLHIHVLSVDRISNCLKHRKHYNSFATPFLLPVEDLPLEEGDPRLHPGREGYLGRDLVCWRCGRDFGNKIEKLKEHLLEEFEGWKRE